jgi:acyl dehydratase
VSPRREVAQVTAGDELPPVDHPIQRIDLVRYAGASGDLNPIHWDEQWATSVGLPGVIAHGMFSMAIAARMLSAYAGDPAAVKRVRVRFSAMIRPGQTLTVSGEVAGVEGKQVSVRFWGEDDAGNRVLSKGEAELELA